jgi:hypothetical protein
LNPQLPISVDEETGVWTTDGLPMIYVPRHFFVNNHIEAEAAAGKAVYAQSLHTAGHRSAHFWCAQESRTHGLQGMAVYEHYLRRLSQRGWGLFSFIEADPATGSAQVKLQHSVFVLAQGIAGVPVNHDKVCYLFAGWFSGAMDWVIENSPAAGDASLRTTCVETQCAAEGHTHCVFTVRALSRS